MALIKSDNDSLREVFIQWMYTITHTLSTHKHRDLQSRFGREKTHTSTNSEEKPQKVLIAASFEGHDEKAQ